jgi:hypothetical protein
VVAGFSRFEHPENVANRENATSRIYAVFRIKKSTSSDEELSISTLKYSMRPVR